MHQVAQGHARLHLAFEAHQDALRHIQRHHACSSSKRHQARACRERNTNGETCVAIATGTHGVRQQHAVEPRVDDAVAWLQTDTTTVADEVRQLVVHLHVHGLGISSGVAERLHHQVSAKAQACEVFQLVARHRAGGVL